jgi:GNAT superfamily N-acetyltransferase
MDVRPATREDVAAVLGILDAAMLETDVETLRQSIDAGATLVAVEDGRLLGALVRRGDRIDAIAVRPRRRDQGIGRALVEAAADRRERLVATFDPSLREFYDSLGFRIEPAATAGRLRGVRD